MRSGITLNSTKGMRNLLTKVCFLCTLALFTAEPLTVSAETGIFPILAKNKKKKEKFQLKMKIWTFHHQPMKRIRLEKRNHL